MREPKWASQPKNATEYYWIFTIDDVHCILNFAFSLSVPGQPGKFKVGKVTDTSVELTWEPAYTKEKIVNYELLYKPVKFGSLVSLLSFFCCVKV